MFYDQLGCRRSDKPDDPSLWVVDRFVAEVEAVRRALHLRRYHLYYEAKGDFSAPEYLARRRPRRAGLWREPLRDRARRLLEEVHAFGFVAKPC